MARPSETPIKTMLIDRRTMVRGALAAALECLSSVRVCAQAATAEQALAALDQAPPHVIVLALTDEQDLSTLARLLGTAYGQSTIALIEAAKPHLAVRAHQRGALNLLHEDVPLEHLIAAIENLHISTASMRAGAAERAYGEPLAESLLHSLPALRPRVSGEPNGTSDAASRIASLTRREREVMHYVTAGFTSSQITEQLGITTSTLRHHLTSIFKKLEVANRVELTVFAYHHNLGAPQQAARGA